MKAIVFLALATALAGCSGSPTPDDGSPDAGSSDVGGEVGGADLGEGSGDAEIRDSGPMSADTSGADAASLDGGGDAGPIGGERPVKVVVPSDWSADKTYPVVMVLHGYTANSTLQNAYFKTGDYVDELQYILVLPEGTTNSAGQQFWEATNACCDFGGDDPGDSEYLAGVLRDVHARYSGDPKRTVLLGHSNGGFMSYRMACDHADLIAAIGSLAGATWEDASQCEPSEPVAVVQMHGTFDSTVPYGGRGPQPGAEETVEQWRVFNGCEEDSASSGPFNYDVKVVGDETEVSTWSGCDGGVSVELWKMNGSDHIPTLKREWTEAVLNFLLSQSKP